MIFIHVRYLLGSLRYCIEANEKGYGQVRETLQSEPPDVAFNVRSSFGISLFELAFVTERFLATENEPPT